MLRILVLMITFALMTGSAFCSIENLMRIFGGGSANSKGSGSSTLDVNRVINVIPPTNDFSFGYGFRPGFF
ncbi:ejaculatory bulb-specific protein 2 [Drosophila teissieri]|uniref:ejaculatory bulb-specific protein 2 n=1 Tax=Drosophila teissieri TaxID=7243 RepID=UPI001CB9DCC1|nr:ejaculatory bulb-specific protein 2 [Drosophila teissieri]